MSVSRAVILVGMVVGCGACGDTVGTEREIGLEPVMQYGWATARPDSTGRLPSDAGVLGRVRAILQAPDSNVYVLEGDWNKIVVFSPDGTVARTIELSVGEGPGEVQLVRDMGFTSDGHLAILDYELARVVTMTTEGEPVATIRLERHGPMYFAISRDTIWVTTNVTPGEDRPSIWALNWEGELLREGPGPVDPAFGAGLSLALAPGGALLESSRRPGLWRRTRGVSPSVVQGTELFPNLEPPVVTRPSERLISVSSPRAGATGLGVLPNGVVVQSYIDFTFTPTEDRPPDPNLFKAALVFFTPGGERLGEVLLDEGELFGRWYISPLSGNVFVTTTEPYPMITEYEIVGLPEE